MNDLFWSILFTLTLAAHLGPQPQAGQATVKSPSAASGANTNLMISVRRVVLQGAKRNAEVYLMNNSSERCTYRVKVGYKDMREDGSFLEREEPREGEVPWQNLIRFSPRQVSLGPGESQVVRLSVRKPADLPPGEFRYYLTLQVLPPTPEAAPPAQKDGIEIKVQAVYGVAIPVIYRNGNLHGTAGLADLSFEAPKAGQNPVLAFKLTRSGDASIYGHLLATFTPRNGGEPEEVGMVKGIAVYTGMAQRTMRLELNSYLGQPWKAGKLHLTFTPDGARTPEVQADLELP